LADPALGTKQICPTCQAKFYDLGRRPAHCPKCGSDFDPEEAVKSRRIRARAVTPDYEDEAEDQVKDKAADSDEEEEDVAAPEIDEAVEDPIVVDDEDEGDVDPAKGPADDVDLGVGEEDVDLEDDEEDTVPFLEDEEDDSFEEDIDLPGEGEE